MFGRQSEFEIKHLHSGGIISNYYCTSACGHCLYYCSPRWKKEYIDRETLIEVLKKIKSLGCRSVHIGGGEPFLNLAGLQMVVETVHSLRVNIEYVETNSSWFKERESAIETLSSLRERGLSTLLISMSPFHNEHIPFYKVKGVIEACREANISVFPWISEFYPEIAAFDDRTTHTVLHPNCALHTLIHTFAFEIKLPHKVVIPPKFDIKISAIYVKSATPPKCFDLFLIPLVLVKFTSWQDISNSHS